MSEEKDKEEIEDKEEENEDALGEHPDTIIIDQGSGTGLAAGYITTKPQERTELNKGEIRGLAVVKAVAKDMEWSLIGDICNEYYLHMRSYRRKGIQEDVNIISSMLMRESMMGGRSEEER